MERTSTWLGVQTANGKNCKIFIYLCLVQARNGSSIQSIILLLLVDWIRFEDNDYYFSNTPFNWQTSRSTCQDQDADLVVITNQREQQFVLNNTQTCVYTK